jgi:hypothetical protein
MRLATCAALLHVLRAPLQAGGDPQVRIAAVDPGESAVLGAHQRVNVRLAYDTEEPIRLWVRPFARGVEVDAYSNPSEEYTGQGDALGWFELVRPGEVDEIRVRAGGGKPYREWQVTSLPVSLQWTAQSSGGAEAAPDWVGELQDAANARAAARQRAAASQPASASETVLFSGFMLLMLGIGLAGIAWPLLAWWKWRGGWRVAAALPAAAMCFVVLRLLIDTARDPTSHNLWPFEILIWSGVCLLVMGALQLARRLLRVAAPDA